MPAPANAGPPRPIGPTRVPRRVLLQRLGRTEELVVDLARRHAHFLQRPVDEGHEGLRAEQVAIDVAIGRQPALEVLAGRPAHGIGLALIDSSVAIGDTVGVLVRNRVEEFEVVKAPFVQPTVR